MRKHRRKVDESSSSDEAVEGSSSNKRKKGSAGPPALAITKKLLEGMGGPWEGLPPFSGDEDKLYRWVAEPALWGRVIFDKMDHRTQQRLVQLHAALHDGMDASGFVLWRTMPPLVQEGLALTMRHGNVAPFRRQLPKVTLKQAKFPPSSRFGDEWEMRSHAGPPENGRGPAWLQASWRLMEKSTFPFLGSTMPMVDEAWSADRFARTTTITHALCEVASEGGKGAAAGGKGGGRGGKGGGKGGGGGGGKKDIVAAAALESAFPAERLLRSLVNAGKDDEVLYIDAICADRYGAAYRLLCDMVAARRAQNPHKRLIIVLMAVVSSDVLKRYLRWGFSFGGVLAGTDLQPKPLVTDRIDRLWQELAKFEQAACLANGRPSAAASPVSVLTPSGEGGLASADSIRK